MYFTLLLKNLLHLFGSFINLYNHSKWQILINFVALFLKPLNTSKLPPTPTKIPFVNLSKLSNINISCKGIPRATSVTSGFNDAILLKTSCLFSYVHNLPRDYNAHYYRPTELGCDNCVMKEKCHTFKQNLPLENDLSDIIPFDYEIINKQNHICILKQKGICEFPTEDCAHISGNIIRITEPLTTSDVRVIKWLTGYTVDANFYESPEISESWIKDKSLLLKKS